jgi:hypothetical protein
LDIGIADIYRCCLLSGIQIVLPLYLPMDHAGAGAFLKPKQRKVLTNPSLR